MKRHAIPSRAVLLALGLVLGALPARAQGLCAQSHCAPDGIQPGGALYRVCLPEPECWNGDLVIWAHGYVAFNQPLAIPDDQLELPDGTSIPAIANELGFAFATTSYRTNGLAIKDGVHDVRELVEVFSGAHGAPGHTYLLGASEGGIVTALATEQHPDVFSGGLATCGPIGSFRGQLNYWGDFRALFDVYFPNVIPGSAIDVPSFVIDQWDSVYQPGAAQALAANPAALDALLRVSRAPFDSARPASKLETALGLLWYSVFATNDGVQKLGGNPFDNTTRIYTGSANDLLLNLRVRRYRADPAALQEVAAHYETTGRLVSPLVTLHTTGDPIIPFAHELAYYAKVVRSGSLPKASFLPVARYGHCQFTAVEAVVGFALLLSKARAMTPAAAELLLADDAARAQYRNTMRVLVASP
jgi:pimeloyl-ACP methyl ester carboxylesterase